MWRRGQIFLLLALLVIWAFLGFWGYFAFMALLAQTDASPIWQLFWFAAIALVGFILLASVFEVLRFGRGAQFLGGADLRIIGQLVTQNDRRTIKIGVVRLQRQWVTKLEFDMFKSDESDAQTPYVLSKGELGVLIDLLKRARVELNQGR